MNGVNTDVSEPDDNPLGSVPRKSISEYNSLMVGRRQSL